MLDGRYLYCITNVKEGNAQLGNIGIENNTVYLICHKELAAIVHACGQRAYATMNDEKAKEWVLTHQYVIDRCMKNYGAVIPFGFDVIVKGGDEEVKKMLEADYEKFGAKLQKLEGKAQYGIQVFFNKEEFGRKAEENEEVKKINNSIAEAKPGLAHILKKKAEKLTNELIAKEVENQGKGLMQKINGFAEEIRVEKPKEDVLLNLACLVSNGKAEELGKALDEINNGSYKVKFTGPWPPYNFCD